MKSNKKQKGAKPIMRRVFRECAHAMRSSVILYTIAEILTGILGVITANKLGEFTDAAFNLNLTLGIKNVVALAGCIIAAVFIAPAFNLVGDFSMLKKSLRHDNLVFGRYLDKECEKAIMVDAGELQYQLEDAPNTMRIQWVRLLTKALALPVSLGYLIYCAGRINWLLTGLMLLLAVTRLVTPMLFKTKLAKYDKLAKSYNAKRRAYETDVTVKPYLIKLWGIQKPILNRINRLFSSYYNETESKYITCQELSEQVRDFVNKITQLLLFLFGAVMVAQGHVTPGEFTAMLIYLTVAQTLLNDIGEIIQNYPLLINAATRVCEFYQDQEIISGKHIDHFRGLKGERIGFAFSDKKIFQDLNFSISAGDKVGIFGENGSGKSTLSKIINSTIKSYSGVITTDNVDFKTINVENWRRIITYAPQTPHLFSTTVRESIIMGNPVVEKETVDELMNDFGILPLADRVISMDSELSGGEKQKISLLRALVKKSDLLILDEPSNHLDQESITALKKYIAATDKAVILITHDASLQEVAQRQIKV